jgi:hypothetical protein
MKSNEPQERIRKREFAAAFLMLGVWTVDIAVRRTTGFILRKEW